MTGVAAQWCSSAPDVYKQKYVPDPNKEKLRKRTLIRKFEEYRESKQKRLKVFRLEAVRAGFKKAWKKRDYGTIIAVE